MNMARAGGAQRSLTLSALAIILTAIASLVAFTQPTSARQSGASPAPNPLETGVPAVTIHIQAFKYSPDSVTLKIGQALQFRTDDDSGHTATASDGSFDSGYLAKGATWSTTFSRAGTVLYSDIYHPSMHGQIIVVVN